MPHGWAMEVWARGKEEEEEEINSAFSRYEPAGMFFELPFPFFFINRFFLAP